MGKERQDDLTARVLAWQHRHPLARRLALPQVHSAGWLALPFVAPAGADGEPVAAHAGPAPGKRGASAGGVDRAAPAADAAARPARRGWRPAFDEPVLASCSVRRLARWVLRHGVEGRPAQDGLPVREVAADAALAGTAPVVRLWVRTVSLDGGGADHRLLVADGPDAPVLGRRLWSRPRWGAAAVASLVLLVGAGVGAWIAVEAARAAPTRLAAASATTSSGAASVSAPSPERSRAELSVGTRPPTPASGGAAATTPSVPRLAGAEPARPLGSRPLNVGLDRWRPLDDTAKREAREAVAAARAARAASGLAAASAPAGTRSASAAVPGAPGAPVWAVSTRVLRTRFESEQMLVALRAAAARSGPDDAALRFEVLPVGSDWRAVSWPFAERRAAERLRDDMQARGLRVEVLAF